MSLRNTLSSYGSVAKFFHWLIFTLILLMIIYGFLLSYVPKDYQGFAYNLHKLTGLTILLLMLLRAGWASLNVKPLLPPDTPFVQLVAERVVHYLLYILIIAMPLSGWIGSVAAGRAPHLGNFNFELPIALNKALSTQAFQIHDTLAILIIIVVGVHIAAGLYHHFIKKDNILLRMLPD